MTEGLASLQLMYSLLHWLFRVKKRFSCQNCANDVWQKMYFALSQITQVKHILRRTYDVMCT